MKVVFSGLCAFIVESECVSVGLLKMVDHDHGGHGHVDPDSDPDPNSHLPLIFERTRDLRNLGKFTEQGWTFTDAEGGAWIGQTFREEEFGEGGVPDVTALHQTKTSRHILPNLRSLGAKVAPRELSLLWTQACSAVVQLRGGTLTPVAPALVNHQIEWVFRRPGDSTDVETLQLAEQVVWDDGQGSTTVKIVSNLPLRTAVIPDDGQLTHFGGFYSLFRLGTAEPILLPTDPGTDIDVYPIFCPPALYLE